MALFPKPKKQAQFTCGVSDLEQALTDINEVEKGVFYTLSLTRNEPAYFIFVTLSLICLGLRVALHAFPRFVEIS
jgi:hypothetical protein